MAQWVEGGHAPLHPHHDFRACFSELKLRYETLNDYEAVMTDLLEGSSGVEANERSNLRRAIEEAIRNYFDSIRDRPACLYERLARDHIQEGDIVITFNYDMGIERALRSASLWEIDGGYGFKVRDAQQASKVSVLKLHGSTNWRALLYVHTGCGMGPLRFAPRPALFDSDWKYLGYHGFRDPMCDGIGNVSLFNLMIMPSRNKSFHIETSFGREMEPFWDDLWKQAERAITSAVEIVVIGYSMPDADQWAQKLLLNYAREATPISISCGISSGDIESRFRKQGFKNITAMSTFENWIAEKAQSSSQQPK